ncbi:MAG: hypothetical protein M1281_10375 [Chloroflexi bacterium]|nr:hypothetical protein [Chloroflexota bacterium]
MKRIRRWAVICIGSGLLLCIIAGAVSAWSNRSLPPAPQETDRLEALNVARLEESLHLKSTLGADIWPGWGEAHIPILLWNRQMSFLTGVSNPPTAWELIPGEKFGGTPVYRKPTQDPQNFAVQLDGVWVASMAIKWETDAFMMDMFHQILPPLVRDIFPYRLLIQPSEVQITGVLHETFHVYQISVAPEGLNLAENAQKHDQEYETVDANMHEAWRREIDWLAKALQAKTRDETTALVRQFLQARAQRRVDYSIQGNLLEYERMIEWEEGLAKYVELESWRQAATTPGYQPVLPSTSDPDFKGYATFSKRWSDEISQMKRQASQAGSVRFYYTGMAQGVLLDRLMPDWKTRILQGNDWLEDLLAEAVR